MIPKDKNLSKMHHNEDKNPARAGTIENRLSLKWNFPQAKCKEWHRYCMVQGAMSLLLRNGGEIEFPESLPGTLQIRQGKEVI